MTSLIVGFAAAFLGVVCVAAGAAVTVVEAMFKSDANAAFPSMKDLTNLIKAIAEFVKQFGKLKAGAQLIVAGLIMFGAGVWMLDTRPF
jgi:hypothetical protein